jgi:hypothetical protein
MRTGRSCGGWMPRRDLHVGWQSAPRLLGFPPLRYAPCASSGCSYERVYLGNSAHWAQSCLPCCAGTAERQRKVCVYEVPIWLKWHSGVRRGSSVWTPLAALWANFAAGRPQGELLLTSRHGLCALRPRPGNPQFPFPRFPILPGIGDSRWEFSGDSRRESESGEGIPDFPIFGNQGIPDSRLGRKSGNRGYSPHVSIKHDRSGGQMLPLILKNADFRPPTHVSGGCQWLVASSVGQRPKSPIPVPSPPMYSRFGRESGRESRAPIPDSAKIGKRRRGNP